jgi:hypothetical protein
VLYVFRERRLPPQDILNIQPVIPMGLSEDWNLIVPWITPVISQPVPTQKDVGFFGFGDMGPSFFLPLPNQAR